MVPEVRPVPGIMQAQEVLAGYQALVVEVPPSQLEARGVVVLVGRGR